MKNVIYVIFWTLLLTCVAEGSRDSTRTDSTIIAPYSQGGKSMKWLIGRPASKVQLSHTQSDTLSSDSLTVGTLNVLNGITIPAASTQTLSALTVTSYVDFSTVTSGTVDRDSSTAAITSGTITGVSSTSSTQLNTFGGTSALTGDITITQSGGTSTLNADSTYFAFPDTVLSKASYKVLPFDMTDGRFLEIGGMTGESAYQRFIEKVKGTSWYKDEGRFPRKGAWQITTGRDSVILWDYTVSPVDTVMVFAKGAGNFIWSTSTVSDLDFQDAVLYITDSGATVPLNAVDFIEDRTTLYSTSGASFFKGATIADRNKGDGVGATAFAPSIAIVNSTVNAVSVIRDPEGATDEFGRRLPIVAVATAGGVSVTDAGITAFYDGGAASIGDVVLLPNGNMFYDYAFTSDILRWKHRVQTISADAWAQDEQWNNTLNKAQDLPSALVTLSAVASLANGVFSGSPTVLGGWDGGINLSHSKMGDNENGITIDLSTTHNIARSDTLAWDLGSVNGVFNNPLTASGAGVTFGDGKIGWGATTNGTSHLLRIGDSAFNAGTDDIAITFWAKSSSATNPSGSRDDVVSLQSNPDQLTFYFGTSGEMTFYITDNNNADNDAAFNASIDTHDGNWHHYAGIKTGTSKIELYIDGVLVGSDASLNTVASLDPDSLIVGGQYSAGSFSNGFSGTIDQLAIWKRALVNNEIVWLNNRGQVANGNLSDYLGANDVDYASADPNSNTFTFGNQDTTYHTTTSGLPLARIPSAGGNVTDAHVIASGDSTAIYQATSTKTKIYQPDLTVQQLAQDKGVEFARPVANIKRFVAPSNLHLFDAVVDGAGYGDYTQVDQAIDAGAKSIFIKNGTYDPFDADVAGLYIVGESWDAIIDGGTTDDAIDITATKVIIENLSVKTTAGSGNAFGGVEASSAGTYAIARAIRVIDSDDTGFYSEGADFTVESCLIEDADGIGIQPNALRGRILNNLIITTGSTCINVTANGDNFIIAGNSIHEGTQTSIGINTNGDNGIYDGNIVNTAISDSGTGNTAGDNEIY